jgi:choline-sulfatase
MFEPAAMPGPLARIRSVGDRPTGGLDHRFHAHDRREREVAKIPLNDQTARHLRANYAGKVALIDEQVGRILRVVEDRGDLDNTVIVFTSDHGEMNGDHGLVYKSCFLDGAARIPMIVSTPQMRSDGTAGRVSEAPAELIDLGPTLVGLAGATWSWEQFGVSLAPVLADPAARHREDALCEFEGEVMLLTDRWKAAVNRDGHLYLLVDRQADPGEARNLAGTPALTDTCAGLRLRILERLSRSHRQVPIAGLAS